VHLGTGAHAGRSSRVLSRKFGTSLSAVSGHRRPILIAAVLIALVAGGALAATLGEDDTPNSRPSATTEADTAPATQDETTAPPAGDTTPTGSAPSGGTASPGDERAIEQAIDDLVADLEQRGSPPPGIEPGDLPGSDELSIDTVDATGDSGTATLSSGAVVLLRRQGGRWRVVGVRGP
jgi:hypothetical protein